MATTSIDGGIEPGFEPVAEAFERNFSERGEVGAGFAAYLDGELVADLWAGAADSAAGRAWRRDTIVPVFSGTKGLVATCLLILIERGSLVEAPVSDYWPEFAAHGKAGTLVRHLVSHAGLPGVRGRVLGRDDVLDPVRMASVVAAEAPVWAPGRTLAYHPYTFGWLCGELIRRVDGRDLGHFFADEVAARLHLDLWIGLPADQRGRVARLELAPGYGKAPSTDLAQIYADPIRAAVWGNPPMLVGDTFDWNAPEVHRAGVPGVGAVGEPRAFARLYGCLARGGDIDETRLLAPATVARERARWRKGATPCRTVPAPSASALRSRRNRFPSDRRPTHSATPAPAARYTARGQRCAPASPTRPTSAATTTPITARRLC